VEVGDVRGERRDSLHNYPTSTAVRTEVGDMSECEAQGDRTRRNGRGGKA